jgi:hypothetical protein
VPPRAPGRQRAVPGLDRERAAAALRFHQEIAEAVRTHEREQAYLDNRYSIHPIVGTFQPTSQSARLEGGRLRVLDTYAGEDQDGDGTVPRVSATPLELSGQRRETYVATRHASLQNGASTLVQLAGLLADIGLDLTAYYGLNIRLSLDVDDVFTTTEPVTVRAKAEDERVGLRAIVVDPPPDGLPPKRRSRRASKDGTPPSSVRSLRGTIV